MKMQVEETPHYQKLKRLIPDHQLRGMIERDILAHADQFAEWKKEASKKIPQALLFQIFSEEAEHNAITLQNFLGQWGNLSVEAVSKICLIVRHIEPSAIFEIGSFNGMTSFQMALNSPNNCKVHTLDLPPDAEISGMSEIDTYMFRTLYDPESKRRYEDSLVESKVVQHYGDSRIFDFSPYYGSVDLVLIDGAHDYETKKTDTENALKMIGNKGVIIWDNYDDIGCPDVTRYLGELNLPLYHLKNTNLVIHRRG